MVTYLDKYYHHYFIFEFQNILCPGSLYFNVVKEPHVFSKNKLSNLAFNRNKHIATFSTKRKTKNILLLSKFM